jgi:flavin-binding protein dodecin
MDKVYKKITLVGASQEGLEAAIRAAVARAKKTLRHVEWFEVKEIRGSVGPEGVQSFQVVLEVGFRLEDEA